MFILSRMVAACAKTESLSCRRYRGASFSGKAFRSCCAVQAAVGRAVTATWSACLVATAGYQASWQELEAVLILEGLEQLASTLPSQSEVWRVLDHKWAA